MTATVSYLSMLDLGGQSYIGNLLAIDHANGKYDSFRQKLSEGVSLFTIIALAGLVFLVAVLFGAMNSNVPFLGSVLSNKERWTILLLGSGFLISIPSGVYVTVYRASGQFIRGTMVGNVLRLAHLIISVIVLTTKASPVSYAFVILMANLMSLLIIVLDSRYVVLVCGEIRLSLAAAQRGRQYLRGALQFWLLALANAANQQGVLLVLAALAPSATVASYATHRTAAGLVGYVGVLVQGPLWPEFSVLWAQGRRDELRQVALSAIRIVMLIGGLVAITMWVLLPLIYPFWTNKQLQLKPALFAAFLLQGVLAAGWFTSTWSLLAANQHRLPARWAVANAVMTIVLALFLAPKYGALGVATATIAGDVLCGLAVYPYLAGGVLGLRVWPVYEAMAFSVLMLLPLLMIVVVASHLLEGWLFIGSFTALTAAWCMFALPRALGQHTWQRLMSLGLLRNLSESAS